MERLTEKHEADAQRKEYERRLANGYPRNIPEERFLRLAACEDTGLTPEICANYKTFEDEAISKGVTFKRIVALMEADRDGRVVVLPSNGWLEIVFGDQVLFWGIDREYMEQPVREISVDDADRIGWYDGYKTVYLIPDPRGSGESIGGDEG